MTSLPTACTPSCWAKVECKTCRRTKAPSGRSVPLPMVGAYCDCSGYHDDPKPGHLWPGEAAWYGTMGEGADPS